MKKFALLMLILLQIISSLHASDGAVTAVEKFQITASKSVKSENKPEWSYLVTYVDDYTPQGGHIAPNSQLSIINPSDLIDYQKLFTVNYQTNYLYPVTITIGLTPFTSESQTTTANTIAVVAKFDKSISFSPSSIEGNYSSVSVGGSASEELTVSGESSKPFEPEGMSDSAVINGNEPASMTYSIATFVKFKDESLDLTNLDSSYTMNVTIKVEVHQ